MKIELKLKLCDALVKRDTRGSAAKNTLIRQLAEEMAAHDIATIEGLLDQALLDARLDGVRAAVRVQLSDVAKHFVIKETVVGPRLMFRDLQVMSWFGTENDASAADLAKKLREAIIALAEDEGVAAVKQSASLGAA